MTPLLKRTKNTSHGPIGYGGPPSLAPQKESILKSLLGRPRDGVTLSSENGLSEIDEVIAKNRKLRNMRLRASGQNVQPMVFGEQKKKNPVQRAFDWYNKNVDIPGPYGSPIPKDWPKRSDAFKVGKWNDQVNFVSKNGTTTEKVIQRGALVTGVAATSAAVVTDLAELKMGKKILVDGPSARDGRIFQIRPNKAEGVFRLDFHALGKQAPKGLRNKKFLHYHRWPNMRSHRPFQGGF